MDKYKIIKTLLNYRLSIQNDNNTKVAELGDENNRINLNVCRVGLGKEHKICYLQKGYTKNTTREIRTKLKEEILNQLDESKIINPVIIFPDIKVEYVTEMNVTKFTIKALEINIEKDSL